MQLSHGISSLVVVGRKVTSCLYTAVRVARCFLLVLGAFDALRFAGGVAGFSLFSSSAQGYICKWLMKTLMGRLPNRTTCQREDLLRSNNKLGHRVLFNLRFVAYFARVTAHTVCMGLLTFFLACSTWCFCEKEKDRPELVIKIDSAVQTNNGPVALWGLHQPGSMSTSSHAK